MRTVNADAIVIKNNKILLIKRKNPPFKDKYSLPGGHVKVNETVEQACLRELKEETNIVGKIKKLVGVYSKPGRDPRGPTVSICFEITYQKGQPKPASDAKEIMWFSLKKIPKNLAFDHNKMIKDFLRQ